ncbi:MAG TPA: CotH kinase family protein [Ignavibacteria bacterium]|nr:CotH kinase family protein [Ignavibacteria bacterium]HRA99913.1 CotH kinase family protein [Ignavibacteria bacterium]
MKKNLLVFSFLMLFAAGFIIPRSAFSQGAGDSLFTGIQVHNVNIIFSQPNYWDSLTIYYNQGNEQFLAATVIANGTIINNVGVRLKGNSSYTHPNNKKSFRLSFNEFVSGQKWNGLKGVHLNNFWNDPSFLREKIHLDYCQSVGIVAPRANYVRLSINDTLFALYSLVEHLNGDFLETHFGDGDGDQFKAVDAFGATSNLVSDFRWYGADTSNYTNRYEIKSDSKMGWDRLVSFIDSINHTTDAYNTFSSKVNLNSYYKAMAVDILMGNLDSYVYNGRNFYIYSLAPDYKMNWIVWDASLSMGALPGGLSNIETLPVTYVSSDTGRPLFGQIINNSQLRNEYLMTFCEIFTDNFSSSKLFPKIDSITTIIRPYVMEDPRKMFSNAQFETNIISDLVISGFRIPGVKSYINARRSSVASQLNTLGINCEVGIYNGNETVNDFNLYQNFPNPFNPNTIISYQISVNNDVSLKVYDVLGNEVATLVNEKQTAGNYSVEFKGADLSSGLYFYILKTPNQSVTKKMLLVK